MAHVNQLPCDGDGVCMACKLKPPAEETLTCKTCATPWHVACLASGGPDTMADALTWECPDCSPDAAAADAAPVVAVSGGSADLLAAIRAIESDGSLSEQEKAKRRQELLGGVSGPSGADEEADLKKSSNDVIDIIDKRLNCSICLHLPDRPVTTPCGHNFCLKCFEKWVKQKYTCVICRNEIPYKMRILPRINSALVIAIRMAKAAKSNNVVAPGKSYHFIHNQDRPDMAFTTERAKKPGKANACSGRIFVTVPPDHFGPILAQNDPRLQGILVGETWEDRMECRQWGAHLPHVAGIAGQSTYGAQSVALSGGYEDDEDHGEWFLYTGSGGRDLSGNKRTNKEQSSDQKFEKLNEALRVSCKHGYPVRVVRSHKEKRSSYAPEAGVRYDGVYRIEKCWRKQGIQEKFKVCRYLFVRCDNEPAPWTSDEHGDRPRPLPNIKELKVATDITERKGSPSWDFDEEKGCWMWKKPPPPSKKQHSNKPLDEGEARIIRRRFQKSVKDRLLKEFSCQLCKKVMNMPITTPCAHNFCKGCLEDAFAGQTLIRQRNCEGRRTLRAQKNIMKCPSPSCNIDIAEFLQNPQVNRELMGLIESLLKKHEEEEAEEEEEEEEEKSESNEENNEEKLEEIAEDEEASSEEVQVEEMTEAEAEAVVVVVAKEDEELKKVEIEVEEVVEEVKKDDELKTDVTADLKEKMKQQQKLCGDAISTRASKRTKIAAAEA